MKVLQRQYDMVKGSRNTLLEFCAQISVEDFLKENSSFGRGSIRNLLVHVANTYQYWIGKQGLKRGMEFTGYTAVNTVPEVKLLFEEVNALVDKYLKIVGREPFKTLILQTGQKEINASPSMLFTHVITHEFHHKGQILSLSRHLGYTPVDTDVIR